MPIRRFLLASLLVVLSACSSGPPVVPLHTYVCSTGVSCTQDQACVGDAHSDGTTSYSCMPDHGCATSLAVYCGGARSAVCSSTPAPWTDVDAGDTDFGVTGPLPDEAGTYAGLAAFVTCQIPPGA